jgi:hypothetical protein
MLSAAEGVVDLMSLNFRRRRLDGRRLDESQGTMVAARSANRVTATARLSCLRSASAVKNS